MWKKRQNYELEIKLKEQQKSIRIVEVTKYSAQLEVESVTMIYEIFQREEQELKKLTSLKDLRHANY